MYNPDHYKLLKGFHPKQNKHVMVFAYWRIDQIICSKNYQIIKWHFSSTFGEFNNLKSKQKYVSI